MKKILAYFILFFLVSHTHAQFNPALEWSRCISGTGQDDVIRIINTPEGGVLLGVWSVSQNGDFTPSNGLTDYWLIRLDPQGNIMWKRNYGGSTVDLLKDIIPTSDGGFMMAGGTMSNDFDVSFNHSAMYDVWLVKIDYNGDIEWEHSYGGTEHDHVNRIIQTTDGGYAFTGYAKSVDGDVTGRYDVAYHDIWTVKIDSAGNIEWQKCVGGTFFEQGNDIIEMEDGSFWITGKSSSSDNDFPICLGVHDVSLVHLDATGALIDTKIYGGGDVDEGFSILRNSQGLLIVAETASDDFDVTGNHGQNDFWLVQCDTSGNLLWQECYGGSTSDIASDGIITPDGGYLLIGRSNSNSGMITGNQGDYDMWVMKTDSMGVFEWQKSMGGSASDWGITLSVLENGKIIIGGYTMSTNGDIQCTTGGKDIWMAQMSSEYHMIRGEMFFDANNDNVFNPGEISGKNKMITESVTSRIAFTKQDGSYEIPVFSPGTYSVTPPPMLFFASSPVSQQPTFLTSFGEIDSLNDFAMQGVSVNNLMLNLIPQSIARAGGDYLVNFSINNIGSVPLDGELTIYPDDLFTYNSSTLTPSLISADSVVIPFTTINPFSGTNGYIWFTISTGAQMGDTILASGIVKTFVADVNPNDNRDSISSVIIASFDPNDISANISFIDINQAPPVTDINYLIRFQNTGNDTAFTVIVTDTISPLLDMNNFELITTTHPVQLEYNSSNRLLKFHFNDILLPDSNVNEPLSHGAIEYKISTVPGLQVGQVINNTAYIYFDYNEAVVTNTWAIPVIDPLGINEAIRNEYLNIFPNPATAYFAMKVPDDFFEATVSVVNVMGQEMLRTIIENNPYISFNVNSFPNGIYFVRLMKNERCLNAKMVKQ